MKDSTGNFFQGSQDVQKRKGCNIMCRKLEELRGLSADDLLKFYDSNTIPINIFDLLKRKGVRCEATSFASLENEVPELINKRGRILGAVILDKDDVRILYSNASSKNRIRFTLAHELAHCCLDTDDLADTHPHVEFRFDERSQEEKEIAANVFAGELLIPEKQLIKLYKSVYIPLSDILAKEFCVSISVMEARLRYLRLPFYSPVGMQ